MYDLKNYLASASQFIVDLSGTPHQTLCTIMPTLSCTCGFRKQIEIIVSACLLKIQKLRKQRNNFKNKFKQEKIKTEKLNYEIIEWEKNYCIMKQEAQKKSDPWNHHDNTLLLKNFTLQNTIKQLNLKLLRQKVNNRIVTESQSLDHYLNDLKYSQTVIEKDQDSFLLDYQRKVLSPSKIGNFNLTTKICFK